ncbi:MAG: DUF2867 domain-containing protein [Bacteroidia bacterium]|nr:DUF2867 domain-containing protein [Bacteroidia bacterium]
MQIKESEHLKHDWISHELLKDFEIEDVWRFPVELKNEHQLSNFQAVMKSAMEDLESKGPAGILFKIRFFLGELFGWDKEMMEKELLKKGSLRERYASNYKLSGTDLPEPGDAEFTPVYHEENESLSEIENATVHAALHLGRVPLNEKIYTVQMAVYVKPKGSFGRIYMALIKPFRHSIVYPAFMKMIRKRWERYLAT